jgi:hypothetical protein
MVIGSLACHVLWRKLSFLGGRRGESELPVQLWNGLGEQSSEKGLGVSSSSWVVARPAGTDGPQVDQDKRQEEGHIEIGKGRIEVSEASVSELTGWLTLPTTTFFSRFLVF